jgi:hypothetical protein
LHYRHAYRSPRTRIASKRNHNVRYAAPRHQTATRSDEC